MIRIWQLALLIMLLATGLSVAQEQVRLDHPIRRISGVVQRENGEPVPNIDVEVFGGNSVVATAKSDSKGRFSTDRLEPGDYEVWFTYKPHPVFQDAEYKITLDPKGSKDPLIIKLHPLQH